MFVEHIKSDADELRRWLEALDYQVLISGLNYVAVHKGDPVMASIRVQG
jgi:hypothetical protein